MKSPEVHSTAAQDEARAIVTVAGPAKVGGLCPALVRAPGGVHTSANRAMASRERKGVVDQHCNANRLRIADTSHRHRIVFLSISVSMTHSMGAGPNWPERHVRGLCATALVRFTDAS